MNTQIHIANRSLPLSGQCAFVCAGFEGWDIDRHQAVGTLNERPNVKAPRPIVSRGNDDWTHPGKGSA